MYFAWKLTVITQIEEIRCMSYITDVEWFPKFGITNIIIVAAICFMLLLHFMDYHCLCISSTLARAASVGFSCVEA